MKKRIVAAPLLGVCAVFALNLLTSTQPVNARLLQAGSVTAVQLKTSQGKGPCPITVTFSGAITTNGPANVHYRFTRSDGATGPELTLDFKGAETKEVTNTWTVGDASALPHFEGWQQLKILAPNELESKTAAFVIDCQPLAKEAPVSQQPANQQPKTPAKKESVITDIFKAAEKELKKPAEKPTPNVTPQTDVRITPDVGRVRRISFDNFDFENGLDGWTATGTAFNNQPIAGETVASERVLTQMWYGNGGLGGDYWKGISYPIGIRHEHWIGTYENGAGDGPTGTLTSASFAAGRRYLHFLLGGGKDINRIYVELQVRKQDYDAVWGTGRPAFFGETPDGFARVNRVSPLVNSEELYRYWFDLDAELNHSYRDKTIRLVIVDESDRSWGHINVDDIQQSDDVNSFLSFTRGGFRLYADPDKPVFGFADTHAHPTHEVGFGGNLMAGSIDGDLSVAQSNDTCDSHHKGFAIGNLSALWGNRNPLLKDFIGVADWHLTDGYPNFIGFPKFNVKSHHQQHITWIRRAYDGGLRLLVALGVNNMFISTRQFGPGNNGQALDDESVVYRELDLMKRIASQNSDWMEIANTPADARRIILSGKLAVVLGVEMDNFGNFKDDQYVWGDDRGRDRPLVSLNADNAQRLIDEKLREYRNYGIRQITSLHYVNGVFGGSAIFRGEPQLAGWAFRNRTNVTSGMSRGIGFSLYEDFNAGAAFLGSGLSYATYAGHIQQQPAGSGEVSQVNADGLTNIGRTLMTSMMREGMLVDLEHMSYRSIDDLFDIANRFDYPILSSHTDPQSMSFVSNPIRRFSGSAESKYADFGTSTIRFVRHEGQLLDDNVERIRRSGGTVGPIMLPYRKTTYTGRAWGEVENNCDGSSKTWAQMYMHLLHLMTGKGVALSTDRGMVDFIGPRFGVNAAYSLREERLDSLKKDLRTQQRYAQTNGVRYDRPYTSYHHDLFNEGDVEEYEADAWRALAAWEAGVNPWVNEGAIAESSDVCCRGRIRNYAKGLFADRMDQLARPGAFTGDGPWEQAAMFLLKTNQQPEQLRSIYSDDDIRNNVRRVYDRVRPIYNLWANMKGNNEPLRRLRNGNRDWDINLDGIAHYGMLPDFLQDLKNVGFSQLQFKPLFSSAEDYIEMWEKAEVAKSRVR